MMDKREKEELELLRELHWNARRVLRYNGVNAKRCNDYYDLFKESVYKVNDFNDRIEDDEESDNEQRKSC